MDAQKYDDDDVQHTKGKIKFNYGNYNNIKLILLTEK